MENNLVKLEPCPFCGCRDRRVGIRRMGNNGYRVCCSKCGSLGPHVSVKDWKPSNCLGGSLRWMRRSEFWTEQVSYLHLRKKSKLLTCQLA